MIAVGAILDFAVKVNTTGFNLNTIGLILMIIGAIGLVLSLVFWGSWGGFGSGGRRMTRVRTDGYAADPYAGGPVTSGRSTYVEEERRL